MYVRRYPVTVATDASGDGTGYTEGTGGGLVRAIRYVKSDYDNTADFTVTCETSGLPILAVTNVTASTSYAPRMATNKASDGSAALYAAAGEAVNDLIPVGHDERIKIVVAQGGNAKTGTFHVYVG